MPVQRVTRSFLMIGGAHGASSVFGLLPKPPREHHHEPSHSDQGHEDHCVRLTPTPYGLSPQGMKAPAAQPAAYGLGRYWHAVLADISRLFDLHVSSSSQPSAGYTERNWTG